MIEKNQLAGKKAIITGASYGIGKALAIGFSEIGAEVGIISRSRDKLENVVKIIEGKGFANDVMTFYQASKAAVLTGLSSFSKSTYISQMFRANYGFDDRYLFTATVRRDGYSAFGNDTKYGIFPSFAVGWNMTNESFLENLQQIDLLKLRLS